jgi:hypothetical protein
LRTFLYCYRNGPYVTYSTQSTYFIFIYDFILSNFFATKVSSELRWWYLRKFLQVMRPLILPDFTLIWNASRNCKCSDTHENPFSPYGVKTCQQTEMGKIMSIFFQLSLAGVTKSPRKDHAMSRINLKYNTSTINDHSPFKILF